jgi:hypothetical protein
MGNVQKSIILKSLCLTKGRRHVDGGLQLQIPVSLFFASKCMEISGQLHAPALIPPWERAPGTHWIGGGAGPTAGLNTTEK